MINSPEIFGTFSQINHCLTLTFRVDASDYQHVAFIKLFTYITRAAGFIYYSWYLIIFQCEKEEEKEESKGGGGGGQPNNM